MADGLTAPSFSSVRTGLNLPSFGSTSTFLSRRSGSGTSLGGGLPDVEEQADLFRRLFPDPTSGTTAVSTVRSALANLPALQPITVPTIPRATIAFPQGGFDQLQQSLFQAQFDPIQRELSRQREQGIEELRSVLAQRGLAESGAGVGQEVRLGREFDQRAEDAARDISASATAQRFTLQAELATRQAVLDQERSLTQAGLSVQAATANARAILERGALETDALTRALAIDTERINTIRDSFVSFFSATTNAALQRSEIARRAAADVFDAVLRAEDLRIRAASLGGAGATGAAAPTPFPSGTFALSSTGLRPLSPFTPGTGLAFRPNTGLRPLSRFTPGTGLAFRPNTFTLPENPFGRPMRGGTSSSVTLSPFDAAKLGVNLNPVGPS